MHKRNLGKILALTIVLALQGNVFAATLSESETYIDSETDITVISTPEEGPDAIFEDYEEDIAFDYDYQDYLRDHEGAERPDEKIVLENTEAKLSNAQLVNEYKGRSDVIHADNTSEVEYEFYVEQEGMYSVSVEYNTLFFDANREYRYSFLINGNVPFRTMRHMSFAKTWVDILDEETGEFFTDSRGNQLTPRQTEVATWQERYIEDIEGFYTEPFIFFFNEGINTITFVFRSGGIALGEVKLRQYPEIPSYEEYLDNHSDKPVIDSDEIIFFEAEYPYRKSDPVLHARFDRSSPATRPQDPSKIKMNTIGGNNWRLPGQWISWRVDIPREGMYRLVLRGRQNYVRGVRVSRKIYINGQIPFKEFETYHYPFDNRWFVETHSGEDGELLVYLEEGENEIKMEVTPSYPTIVRKLQENIFSLNETYRSIIMITGVGATGNALDEFRDYNLDREIPGFMETLERHYEELTDLRREMSRAGFETGGEVVVVEDLIRQIKSFIEDTDTIPMRLQMFKDNISGASTWILRLKEQPFEIDWMAFAGKQAKLPEAEKGFFQRFWFSVQTFLVSFINDYTVLDEGFEGEEVIDVWVGLSREQTELIKRLIDDYFTPDYGIRVNVNLVQQGLIPATLTGKGPDLALFVPPSDIINLAARNALAPIQDYEGYEEVTQRFQANSMIPYTYMDNVYALPISEAFTMMFYRRDVFQELGISPPRTWTEFYDLILILQRNNLTIGVPSDESMFQTLVFQHGGDYYKTPEWRETAFDTPEVLEAFKQWTDFYAKYSLPVVFDFYSRFRTGEMPLGIAPYTIYNQLNVAAPEIRGLWQMVPIPGVLREDGTINNANTGIILTAGLAGQPAQPGVMAGGGMTGITMFEKTENKLGGWELMKWWTSAEIQARYGREIETIMGPAARFDTANIEAFRLLPWTEEEEEQLLDQWSKIQMVQQTPVNYYISRHLLNAFRGVVIRGDNHRETLNFYNRDINMEIIRKQIEFGLME